jgi:serine/threonine protein kinase
MTRMLDLSKSLFKKISFILNLFFSSHHAMLFVTCQISGALSYLESRQLIHRDVSTRNCLVFSDYIIKLTDIAMASPIYSNCYSTDAHLPVRWMSPEVLMVSFWF